jgi:hypothetical protein
MDEIQIPHAESAVIDRVSSAPREILVIVTKLPKRSPAGPDADARYELLKAVAEVKARFGLHGDDIRWESKADRA